jgi:hypothetical protein
VPPFFRVVGEICRRNATYEDAVIEFIARFGTARWVDAMFGRRPEWREAYGANEVCVAGPDGHRAEVYIYGDATEEKSTVYSRVKMYGLIGAMLAEANLGAQRRVPASNPPVITRIETVNDALSHDLVVINPECEQLIRDFESGVWNGSQSDMDQYARDEEGLTRSHASSAFGYFLCRQHRIATSLQPAATRARRRQDLAYLIPRW